MEHAVRWSVGIEVEGDQVLTREQVVDLADAVAATARLRRAPIVRTEAVSEDEDAFG